MYTIVILLCVIILHISCAHTPETVRKPRIIVTTDGEIDDRCSMVRFLLYTNEWDIEGIVISSSTFHWKGHDWAGEDWIDEDIDLYAESYENLIKHDPDFLSPEELKKLVYVGNIDSEGEMEKDTPGSDKIVEVLLDNEPGPVYLQAWGGTNTIARALWKIQHEHPDQMEKVSKKAVIYIILDQDNTFREYIQPNWPDLQVLRSRRQFEAVAYSWQGIIPKHLHKYWDGPWMTEHIIKGHGPLNASYEAHDDDRFRSEGDSPSFWHQIRVGLGSLEDPSYGGWGGRFVRVEGTENVWRGAEDDGSWSKPLWRWSEAIQNDWAARADWCVMSYDEANHNPTAVVNGVRGMDIVRIEAEAGSTVELSAKGSTDPDGDSLSYEWWYYAGPSDFHYDVTINNADDAKAGFVVPYDSEEKEHHIILTVRDNGSPNLFAYRRVIVQTPAVVDDTPPTVPDGIEKGAVKETEIEVSWGAATDEESSVRQYIVYRDGVQIAQTSATVFTDTGLTEFTEYTYQVAAVNGCLMVGPKSQTLHVTTAPDQTPPSVMSVFGMEKKVKVVFDEPIGCVSAENAGNYEFDGSVRVKKASLKNDERTVILAVSPLTDGREYTLIVNGVLDRAQTPNTIAEDTRLSFTYIPVVPVVSVGITDFELPVTLHGSVTRGRDGSLSFTDSEPFGWVAVGGESSVKGLEEAQSFTILGWVRASKLHTGSGGNRIVYTLNHNISGMDLVHHGDGKMRLSVNEWPDGARNDSSPGKIQIGKWVFFAVTYDSAKEEDSVHWYFGDETMHAALDRTTGYNKGPIEEGSKDLVIGNFNRTMHQAGLDRQFRGKLKGISIFASQHDSGGALDLELIRQYQDILR